MAVITQKQIDEIRSTITANLAEKFSLDQVTTYEVPQDWLHGGNVFESKVYALEFIINCNSRYTAFFGVRNGRIGLTRAKEGIVKYLAGQVRPHDFGLYATGDYYRRDDVVGKFLEYVINMIVNLDLETMLGDLYRIAPRTADYSYAYYVTRRHKATMSYDCEFEVLVRGERASKYEKYKGEMINGRLTSFKHEGDEVPFNSIF